MSTALLALLEEALEVAEKPEPMAHDPSCRGISWKDDPNAALCDATRYAVVDLKECDCWVKRARIMVDSAERAKELAGKLAETRLGVPDLSLGYEPKSTIEIVQPVGICDGSGYIGICDGSGLTGDQHERSCPGCRACT